MAIEPKSFADLLKEAPAAPAAGTVSLTGTLSQSSEAGKFVLTLEDGNSMTLETAAVKSHAVLGTSVGSTIVRVEIDGAKLPPGPTGAAGTAFTLPSIDFATIAAGDRPHTIPDVDIPFTVPVHDFTVAWIDHHQTHPWIDYYSPGTGIADQFGPNTIQEGMPQFPGAGGDPVQAGGIAPFALATAHQAPANTLAAIQGMAGQGPGGQAMFNTLPVVDFSVWWDQPQTGWADQHHTAIFRDKQPPDDGATNLGSRFLD